MVPKVRQVEGGMFLLKSSVSGAGDIRTTR